MWVEAPKMNPLYQCMLGKQALSRNNLTSKSKTELCNIENVGTLYKYTCPFFIKCLRMHKVSTQCTHLHQRCEDYSVTKLKAK